MEGNIDINVGEGGVCGGGRRFLALDALISVYMVIYNPFLLLEQDALILV